MANVGDYSGSAQPGLPAANRDSGFFDGAAGFVTKNAGAIGMGAGVGGAIGGALASFYSAKSAKLNAEMSAQFARHAAAQEEQRAVDVSHNYSEEFFRKSLKEGQMQGAQRARAFAQGGGGESVQRIMADTKFFSALDNKTLASNEEKELFAIRQSARAKTSQANTLETNAKSISPWARALGSLASGVASTATSYAKANYRGSAATRTVGIRG